MSRTVVDAGEAEVTGKTSTCPQGTNMMETDNKLGSK